MNNRSEDRKRGDAEETVKCESLMWKKRPRSCRNNPFLRRTLQTASWKFGRRRSTDVQLWTQTHRWWPHFPHLLRGSDLSIVGGGHRVITWPPPTTLFALQKETQRFFMSCGDGLQPWRTCLEPRCGCSYRVVRSVMAPKHTAGWSMANESLPERRKTPPILKTLLNLSSGHFNGERASDVLPSFCAFPIWKREAPAVTMKAGAVNGRRESLPGKKMFSLSIIQLRSSYQC